jgi:CRISPR-associated endonuclease/helicase Cas3
MPTGAGKTSAIVVWLLAFIKNPTLSRRLVYVVDRRSVVDQATAVIEKMVEKLSTELKAALAQYSLFDEALLGVSTLRGELADNEEWSKFPFRPSVTVGTVDKIGSALLFSSYGDGAYNRSKKAGLLANDALVIFDECHLVPTFQTLLHNIEVAGGKLKPFAVMTMSATSTSHDTLSLTDADLTNVTLAARLNAKKTVTLVEAVNVQIKLIPLALQHPPARTIIFVRSPRDAAKIADSIRQHYPQTVACLTGTLRGKERDELADNPTFKAFTVPVCSYL